MRGWGHLLCDGKVQPSPGALFTPRCPANYNLWHDSPAGTLIDRLRAVGAVRVGAVEAAPADGVGEAPIATLCALVDVPCPEGRIKGSCEAPAYAAPSREEQKKSQTRALAGCCSESGAWSCALPATLQSVPALTITLQALLLSCSDRKADGGRAQEALGSRFRAQLLPPRCSQL